MLTIKSNVNLSESFEKLKKCMESNKPKSDWTAQDFAYALGHLDKGVQLHIMECVERYPCIDPNDIPKDMFTASASDTEREIIEELEVSNTIKEYANEEANQSGYKPYTDEWMEVYNRAANEKRNELHNQK